MTSEAHRHYVRALAAATGTPPERLATPGTTVVATDDRAGSNAVSHYLVGTHSLLWADPDLVPRLVDWDGLTTPTPFDEFDGWAADRGAHVLGGGADHVLPGPLHATDQPAQVVPLDPSAPDTIARAKALFDACSADDLEEAEFELDALDPYLAGWIATDDSLLALGGARPWNQRPGFVDIGVLTHPAKRRQRCGRHVVAAVTRDALVAGEWPLYRCDVTNTGSRRIALDLGFTVAASIRVLAWPSSGGHTGAAS